MHRTVAAALAAALALALASCGGSGTRTAGGTAAAETATAEAPATLSRAELVRRLETACLAGSHMTYKAHPPRDPRAYARLILVNERYVLKRVGNLETTGPAKAVFDGYKHALRKEVAALERVVSAPSHGFWSVVAKERPVISASGLKTHEAILALHARHVC